ncbi:type II/IV secretion system protein [Candidatus Parcubacteria bacterium]|jgi:type IV pilus assembly protein PilB|nr:type II/IV secretion system protein [Candidatus Parcubacteria bacterium]MBT7228892.1 type II/IV secretion system protein [Candidatus Parcubacteria bacterium]
MNKIISDEKIYQIISKIGLIETSILDTALKTAKERKKDFATFLIKQNLIKAEEIGQLIANQLHIRFVNLAKQKIKSEILGLIPEVVARKQKMIVFGRDEEGVKIAMTNPFDYAMIKMVEKKVGDKVNPYYATQFSIDNSFSLYRKTIQQEYASSIQKHAIKAQGSAAEDISVVSLVDDLFSYAYTNHASDIHIEPADKEIIVRFRIDGILYDVLKLPKNILNIIVARIKILAQLRTDEIRSAQDGKIVTTVEGEKLDIRVSSIPITQGEKIVMRLLSSKGKQFDLEGLGMNGRDFGIISKAAKRPYGMILVTGPTGSGKTTTLYAVIKILNSRNVNICTIEDPVEYDLTGVNQIQVNANTNLTFASGLRSLLRQDPDIIMVGEIRDEETAAISINSAMTGHLVLTTLHTNDASTALPRLFDMNVEPFLVASTVNVVVAQRLIRRICMKCIVSYTLDEKEVEDLKSEIDISKFLDTQEIKDIRFYKGKGCENCNNSGYAGRIGIFEVLQIDEEIKNLILSRADADTIRKKAMEQGMTTMFEDGFKKAISGKTTLEEIFRVTKQ